MVPRRTRQIRKPTMCLPEVRYVNHPMSTALRIPKMHMGERPNSSLRMKQIAMSAKNKTTEAPRDVIRERITESKEQTVTRVAGAPPVRGETSVTPINLLIEAQT